MIILGIALARGKKPILGVTYAFIRDELYVAVEGEGTFCNGERVQGSSEEDIKRVQIGFDGGKETETFKRASISSFMHKLYATEGIRAIQCTFCASVPLACVASGRLHAYCALSLQPWDMAVGYILNMEAGNKVTTIDGREWNLDEPSIFVANPVLHSKLSNFLEKEINDYCHRNS